MQWADVLADPHLQDLPYKIELNEYGSIVKTPASNRHGNIEYQLAKAIDDATPSGRVMVECSIDTKKSVKVADVVWRSDDFLALHGEVTPYPTAPELCVEVVSPSNSQAQLNEKRELYFEQGAKEVWFYMDDDTIMFFSPEGHIQSSSLIPGFPNKL